MYKSEVAFGALDVGPDSNLGFANASLSPSLGEARFSGGLAEASLSPGVLGTLGHQDDDT